MTRRQRRARRSTSELGEGHVPEAVDSADPALAGLGAGLLRPADVQLDADARRAALPAPGRGRPELRHPARRRRHRRDLVLERHDLPGGHGPLLARPRRRREPDRPDVVGDRDVPEAARRAGRRSRRTPTQGEMLPVWAWSPIQGASSYDLAVDGPDGTHRDYGDIRTPAVSFIKMTGTGVWHWRVRAEFPKAGSGETPGPYSAMQSFTRTIGEPVTRRPTATKRSRPAQLGPAARREGVQGADRLERRTSAARSRTVTTDNTSYAPTMTRTATTAAATLYWRVAGGGRGSQPGRLDADPADPAAARLRLMVSGLARHKHMGSVRVTVSRRPEPPAEGRARAGDRRRYQASWRRRLTRSAK